MIRGSAYPRQATRQRKEQITGTKAKGGDRSVQATWCLRGAIPGCLGGWERKIQ
jgi:hypothetical protein